MPATDNPDLDFTGQVAVVTGAGRGLGRAYALDLARRGAAVFVSDVALDDDGLRADKVVAEIVAAGGRAISSDADISTPDGVDELVARVVETLGGISVVVHNAGFLRPNLVADLTDDQIDSILEVHLSAAIRLARSAWPHMVEAGYGRFVLTSSGSSFGHMGQANYVAAKAGIIGLTRALALESLDLDIRTNCILPYAQSLIGVENPLGGQDEGRIRPLLNAMNSRRTAESVAPLVTYLASRACSVNGEAFSALAGRYARVLFALTPGWTDPGLEPVTAEAIQAHFSDISRTDGASFPASMEDQIVLTYDELSHMGLLEPVGAEVGT